MIYIKMFFISVVLWELLKWGVVVLVSKGKRFIRKHSKKGIEAKAKYWANMCNEIEVIGGSEK